MGAVVSTVKLIAKAVISFGPQVINIASIVERNLNGALVLSKQERDSEMNKYRHVYLELTRYQRLIVTKTEETTSNLETLDYYPSDIAFPPNMENSREFLQLAHKSMNHSLEKLKEQMMNGLCEMIALDFSAARSLDRFFLVRTYDAYPKFRAALEDPSEVALNNTMLAEFSSTDSWTFYDKHTTDLFKQVISDAILALKRLHPDAMIGAHGAIHLANTEVWEYQDLYTKSFQVREVKEHYGQYTPQDVVNIRKQYNGNIDDRRCATFWLVAGNAVNTELAELPFLDNPGYHWFVDLIFEWTGLHEIVYVNHDHEVQRLAINTRSGAIVAPRHLRLPYVKGRPLFLDFEFNLNGAAPRMSFLGFHGQPYTNVLSYETINPEFNGEHVYVEDLIGSDKTNPTKDPNWSPEAILKKKVGSCFENVINALTLLTAWLSRIHMKDGGSEGMFFNQWKYAGFGINGKDALLSNLGSLHAWYSPYGILTRVLSDHESRVQFFNCVLDDLLVMQYLMPMTASGIDVLKTYFDHKCRSIRELTYDTSTKRETGVEAVTRMIHTLDTETGFIGSKELSEKKSSESVLKMTESNMLRPLADKVLVDPSEIGYPSVPAFNPDFRDSSSSLSRRMSGLMGIVRTSDKKRLLKK